MEKKVLLLSKSKERKRLLEERGFECLRPLSFQDLEKEEDLCIKVENVLKYQKELLERKLSFYEDFLKDFYSKRENERVCSLIDDSVVFFESPSLVFNVLSKVKSEEDFLHLYDNFYSKEHFINIETCQFVVVFRDNGFEKSFDYKNTRIELVENDSKNKFDKNILEKYLEQKIYLNRTGGIDISFFQEHNFKIQGDIDSARGVIVSSLEKFF